MSSRFSAVGVVLIVAVALVAVGFAGCISSAPDVVTPTPTPEIKYVYVTVTPTISVSKTGLTTEDYAYLDKFGKTGDYFDRALFYKDNGKFKEFKIEIEKSYNQVVSDTRELQGYNTSKVFEPVRYEYNQAILNELSAVLVLKFYSENPTGDPYPRFNIYINDATDHTYKGNDALKNITG